MCDMVLLKLEEERVVNKQSLPELMKTAYCQSRNKKKKNTNQSGK